MLQSIFNYADTFPPAICLIVMFLRFRTIPGYLSPVFWLCLFCFLAYGLTNWFADHKIPNLFLYPFITQVEFLLIAWFFTRSIKSPFKNRIVLYCTILFLLLSITDILWGEGLDKFPSNLISLSSFFYIGFSFLYYADMIETSEIFRYSKHFAFWIVTAIFVYSTVCFFVFFFYRYKVLVDELKDKEWRSIWWKIQEVMLLVKYAFFIVGILWHKKL